MKASTDHLSKLLLYKAYRNRLNYGASLEANVYISFVKKRGNEDVLLKCSIHMKFFIVRWFMSFAAKRTLVESLIKELFIILARFFFMCVHTHIFIYMIRYFLSLELWMLRCHVPQQLSYRSCPLFIFLF